MKSTLFTKYILITVLWVIFFVFKAEAQTQYKEDEALLDLVYEYSTKGYENYNTRNLDSAEYYLLRALDLQYSNTYNIDERVAINHNTLGSIYRIVYNTEKALYHSNKAEEIMKRTDPTNILLATIYHNKGNIFTSRNDIYRTREYYEYALDFCTKNGYQNTDNFSFVFSNYIKLLFELGEYELAEQKLSSIDLNSLNVSPLIEYRIHLTNAISYSELEKKSLAEYHFRKAKGIIESQKEAYTYVTEKSKYYYNIIDFHILYSEYEKALMECDQAYLFFETLDPISTKGKTIYQSDILYRSASIYYRLGKLDQALRITERGIDNLTSFLDKISIGNSYTSSRNQ